MLFTVLGDQVGSQLTDVLNDKTSIFESQISNALGNIPGVGDITGQLSGKLNDVIGTTANELLCWGTKWSSKCWRYKFKLD